ncbi:hypothetical protein CNEO4_500009 [Clostridium neonatale]|uniref:Uncharacterized protein n=1 Tax=Clostridium neonatale TaxID=137838 RepID=A0AA86JSS4_9CLOT|nr:hypothetical protein CNEO_44960 [Clostridium neonatale]CAI3660811.1 hypothetical protein CNEO4_520009 [Clostridium neonatale]CAI3669973.1 hypothetical protein CNEO4_500009 [Clostridium neonatale]CAI3684197.1 hypothetical protein CNEO4_530009 [Clostridium neonatale]CAI4140825.1 hypothetical protein CNEO4_520009 [Clostridium neonatale]
MSSHFFINIQKYKIIIKKPFKLTIYFYKKLYISILYVHKNNCAF